MGWLHLKRWDKPRTGLSHEKNEIISEMKLKLFGAQDHNTHQEEGDRNSYTPDHTAMASMEQALIKRVVEQNDHDAYRILYHKYSAELLRRLYRLLGRKDAAEDALQQVFLEIYRSLPGYEGKSQFRTWIHRITERVAIAHFRKEWRSRHILERWGLREEDVAPAPISGPNQPFEQQELHAWMQQFLERLPPKKRWVLVLCDLEGRPYEEVAALEGISEGTVASRLHHARKDLRKMIEHALQKQGLRYGDLFHDE